MAKAASSGRMSVPAAFCMVPFTAVHTAGVSETSAVEDPVGKIRWSGDEPTDFG